MPLEIKAEKEQNRKAMSKYFPQGNKNEVCARALVSTAQALAIKTQSLLSSAVKTNIHDEPTGLLSSDGTTTSHN